MPLSQLYHSIPSVSTKITILRISLAASRPAGRTRAGRPFPRKLERKNAPPFYPTRRSLFAFLRFVQSGFPGTHLRCTVSSADAGCLRPELPLLALNPKVAVDSEAARRSIPLWCGIPASARVLTWPTPYFVWWEMASQSSQPGPKGKIPRT